MFSRPAPFVALAMLAQLACGRAPIAAGSREPMSPVAHAPDGSATGSGACVDDSLGNATQMQSYPLTGAAELPGLELCAGTEDWYRLDARSAASFSVSACFAAEGSAVIDFTPFREELGKLFRHENCNSSDPKEICGSTCEIEAPGIYYFRLSAAEDIAYRLHVAFKPSPGNVTQGSPSLDVAPALTPGMPRDLIVCVPFGEWYKLEVTTPSTVTVESTLPYAGYYLDFTLLDEAQRPIDYWPQGPGKTTHALALDPGRFLLGIRSAYAGCREFSLVVSSVAR
jgi:hypothetical protein